MLALRALRSTNEAKQLQQSHGGRCSAFWISEWKRSSVGRNRGSNRERESDRVREERKRRAERKPTIVCPGAPGTRRGVNSDSF